MKGVIYFQAIEEVYYDHLKNAHKVSCKNSARCHNRSFFHPINLVPSTLLFSIRAQTPPWRSVWRRTTGFITWWLLPQKPWESGWMLSSLERRDTHTSWCEQSYTFMIFFYQDWSWRVCVCSHPWPSLENWCFTHCVLSWVYRGNFWTSEVPTLEFSPRFLQFRGET